MSQVMGTYDGEGPNVTAATSGGIGTTANSPDVQAVSKDRGATGQGTTVGIAVDRRKRARTADEGARASVAISYGGGNQVLTNYARAIYITTPGTLVLVLADDANQTGGTFSGLLAGTVYPFCVAQVIASGSTAAGLLLF